MKTKYLLGASFGFDKVFPDVHFEKRKKKRKAQRAARKITRKARRK